MWGVSQMPFLRLIPPIYENGFNTPVGWEKGRLYNGHTIPNARDARFSSKMCKIVNFLDFPPIDRNSRNHTASQTFCDGHAMGTVFG